METAALSLAVFVAIGVASGALSSLAGAGGATLSTAGVRVAGTAPSLAVGSTLPAVLPSAVAGSIRYARAGLVDWHIALTTGASGAVLAVVGAAASSAVDARLLMIVTSVVLGASGAALLRSYRAAPATAPAPSATAGSTSPAGSGLSGRPDAAGVPGGGSVPGALVAPPAFARVALVGGVGGFIAGLLGLGGGLIVVPAFTRVLRMPLRSAVGSSLVAVALLSIPAVVAHSVFGQVDWRIALALIIGVIPGARLGSHLALVASERTVGIVCGAVLVALAAVQCTTEVASLLG